MWALSTNEILLTAPSWRYRDPLSGRRNAAATVDHTSVCRSRPFPPTFCVCRRPESRPTGRRRAVRGPSFETYYPARGVQRPQAAPRPTRVSWRPIRWWPCDHLSSDEDVAPRPRAFKYPWLVSARTERIRFLPGQVVRHRLRMAAVTRHWLFPPALERYGVGRGYVSKASKNLDLPERWIKAGGGSWRSR
jgi:hypothetical protein